MRRVVTGIDEHGKSIFVSDEDVDAKVAPTLGGVKNWMVWGEDTIPVVPNRGITPQPWSFFPSGPGSFRFGLFSYPPVGQGLPAPDDLEQAIAETERMLPGMSTAVTASGGTHFTATVDLEYVVAGEFHLELDDGVSKILRAGDFVVQHGARHHWENRSTTEWATMLLVFLGAELDESRHS